MTTTIHDALTTEQTVRIVTAQFPEALEAGINDAIRRLHEDGWRLITITAFSAVGIDDLAVVLTFERERPS